AESGKPRMVALTGNVSATIQSFARDPSERLAYPILTRTLFMLAWANRRFAGMSRTATAFTNPMTPAQPGKKQGWMTLGRSSAYAFIRKIRTLFMLQPRDMFG